MANNSQIAIYPGTFDPVTYGHIDIIRRAAALFDHLIIAVAPNRIKGPIFNVEERVDLLSATVSELSNIEVTPFSGLLMDYAKSKNANIIIRGLRAISDFEYEIQMAAMNRQLAADVETLFLSPTAEYSFLSSTMVRDVARHNGDVSAFVPEVVVEALAAKFR